MRLMQDSLSLQNWLSLSDPCYSSETSTLLLVLHCRQILDQVQLCRDRAAVKVNSWNSSQSSVFVQLKSVWQRTFKVFFFVFFFFCCCVNTESYLSAYTPRMLRIIIYAGVCEIIIGVNCFSVILLSFAWEPAGGVNNYCDILFILSVCVYEYTRTCGTYPKVWPVLCIAYRYT